MNGSEGKRAGCVLAVAGRRIDAANAEERRFPLDQVARVSSDLRSLLLSSHAVAVVASAANGADLLTLQAAGDLGIHRVVMLPCAAAGFRVGSVADRPGDWGPVFDLIVDEVRSAGSLIELAQAAGATAYAQVTDELIARTESMAASQGLTAAAVAVWDGAPWGAGDMTAYFRRLAVQRGFDLHEVRTTP
jgi:hypothetical protein